MMKPAILGTAAVISATVLAAPAMAQEVISNPGYCAQFYPDANCQNKGPGNPYTDGYQRRLANRPELQYRERAWHRGWRHSWYDER